MLFVPFQLSHGTNRNTANLVQKMNGNIAQLTAFKRFPKPQMRQTVNSSLLIPLSSRSPPFALTQSTLLIDIAYMFKVKVSPN